MSERPRRRSGVIYIAGVSGTLEIRHRGIIRIPVILGSVLMGLLFQFASISMLFNLIPQPALTGKLKIFMDGTLAPGYLLTLFKVTELGCGSAFISGQFGS